MRKIFIFLITFSSILSLSYKDIFSSALDFVPYVGNLKSAGEAIYGKDLITGEELSNFQRTLSLIGAIPFMNFFKNKKYVKIGKQFYKASKRAEKAGKIKNANSFFKAGKRAMNKIYWIPELFQKVTKFTKGIKFSFSMFWEKKQQKKSFFEQIFEFGGSIKSKIWKQKLKTKKSFFEKICFRLNNLF